MNEKMINIHDMPMGERVDLFAKLAKEMVGPLEFSGEKASFLSANTDEVIKPDTVVSIVVPCYRSFRPRRFVILEQLVQFFQATEEPIFKDEIVEKTTGMWWWKKSTETRKAVVALYLQKTICSTYPVPRTAWEVSAMFVGNRVQFPSYARIGGDAFRPDGTMDFDCDVCVPGIHITFQVRHNMQISVPFRAILVGEAGEES